jgi:TetR/AcrR family transcriptional repressor of nem operon
MARPREFDETVILEAAIQCFWAKGLEATSMRDLIGRMGITGASVHNAFGDKRALYRRALAYYLEVASENVSLVSKPPCPRVRQLKCFSRKSLIGR